MDRTKLSSATMAAGSGTIRFGVVGAFRFISGQVSKLIDQGGGKRRCFTESVHS